MYYQSRSSKAGSTNNKLKEDNALISNDLNHLFSCLSEEEHKCNSLRSFYISIGNKENELNENIKAIEFQLDNLKTLDQTITIERRPPNKNDEPQFDKLKTPDQTITNEKEHPKGMIHLSLVNLKIIKTVTLSY